MKKREKPYRCIRCGKKVGWNIPRCRSCMQVKSDQEYLDNCSIVDIREGKDRQNTPVSLDGDEIDDKADHEKRELVRRGVMVWKE